MENNVNKEIAVIIGAGPAGLTAAYELVNRTDIIPIVFELSSDIGGISKTVNYKGNRIDIGGHRFFSKSDRVMDWWKEIMPIQGRPSKDDIILKRSVPLSRKNSAPDPEKSDLVMLIRSRISRIFFLRSFFDYPISLKWDTFKNLGLVRVIRIGISYVAIQILPIKKENSLEEFLINRFGKELYLLFFKDYTEKVWGVPCNKIKPEWGAQRIKGLSITKALIHAVKHSFSKDKSISQKKIETSLIGQFLYPKFGPGQLWEEVAKQIKEKNVDIFMESIVIGVDTDNGKITGVRVKDKKTNLVTNYKCDYVFSTMPIKELIPAIRPEPPINVQDVAKKLQYRDFITVGLLLKQMKIKNTTATKSVGGIIPDNWVYIQERDVKIGRLQVFNNWSPYLVKDPDTIWVGLEYFCNEGDDLWSMPDQDFITFAINELAHINIIEKDFVLDSTIVRQPKAYPAYFGSYDNLHIVKDYVNRIDNLFLIGRNGMHKYNNADHSMLAAMTAVDNIINGVISKENIWEVNTETEYHETKK